MSATDHDFDVENYPRGRKLRLQLQERLRGSASLQECYSCFWHTQSCPQWIYTYPQIWLSSSTVTSSGQQCDGKHWKQLKVFKMQDYLGYSLYLPVIWLETGSLSPKEQVDGLPLWGVFTRSPQHTNKCKEKERDFYRGTYFYFIIVQLLIFTIVDTARLPLLWFLMPCFQKLQQNNSTSKNGPYYRS